MARTNLNEKINMWNGSDAKLKADAEIEGIFKGIRKGNGEIGDIAVLEIKDNERVGVWMNSVLASTIQNVNIGEKIWVIYKGMKTSEKSGREYHDYQVDVDR